MTPRPHVLNDCWCGVDHSRSVEFANLCPEEQDELIASGWHPAPSGFEPPTGVRVAMSDSEQAGRRGNGVSESPFSFRFFREPRGFTVVVGPWAGRFNFARTTRFGNGARWFSGWHRWREDVDE